MTREQLKQIAAEERANIAFIRDNYASAIKRKGKRFYWENADMPPARFYFASFEEAAADLAPDIGVTDEERAPYLA